MEVLDLSEIDRRFFELVDRASRGERFGIAVNGKYLAVLEAPRQQVGHSANVRKARSSKRTGRASKHPKSRKASQ